MAEEFEGDLSGAVFWGADLSGAQFRDVNLTDVTISHAWLVNVDIDAAIERLVVNGVDVTDYVNERDPWHPLRVGMRATTPDAIRLAGAGFDAAWTRTIERVRALPEASALESVNGEFSFVQTIRHLVFAIDKWFVVPVLGGSLTPIGLPNTGSLDFPWPGLDLDSTPSLAEALAEWADHTERFRNFLGALTDDDLERSVEILENGPHTVKDCISTVFEEAFWHLRYATRDLIQLES